MNIIVDTNILFSSLLSSQSNLRDILLEKEWFFYAPNYLFVELFQYKDKIIKYSKLSEEDLYDYLYALTSKITFIKPDFIATQYRQEAYDLCKDIDIKDTIFVALCLQMDALLWSGDKKLKNHLTSKGFDKILEY